MFVLWDLGSFRSGLGCLPFIDTISTAVVTTHSLINTAVATFFGASRKSRGSSVLLQECKVV